LGWVSQLMGWVGLGHTKWTHGQELASGFTGSNPSHDQNNERFLSSQIQ